MKKSKIKKINNKNKISKNITKPPGASILKKSALKNIKKGYLQEFNSDIYKSVGAKIRNYRLDKNISIEELAQKAEISSTFLGNIERGEKKPSLKTLQKIAKALNIDIKKFFPDFKLIENPIPYDVIYIDKIKDELYDKSVDELKKIYNILKNIL